MLLHHIEFSGANRQRLLTAHYLCRWLDWICTIWNLVVRAYPVVANSFGLHWTKAWTPKGPLVLHACFNVCIHTNVCKYVYIEIDTGKNKLPQSRATYPHQTLACLMSWFDLLYFETSCLSTCWSDLLLLFGPITRWLPCQCCSTMCGFTLSTPTADHLLDVFVINTKGSKKNPWHRLSGPVHGGGFRTWELLVSIGI